MYIVVFKSTRTLESNELYDHWSEVTERLVKEVSGFIDYYGYRDPVTRIGVTIAHFESEESVKRWKELPQHLEAQELGRTDFYENYHVYVSKVEREYSWHRKP